MRTTNWLRVGLVPVLIGLSAFKGKSGNSDGGASTDCIRIPDNLPAGIRAPPEARAALELYAEGTQNYQCMATDAGSFAWTLVGPDANLYQCAPGGELIGKHFAGPTWQRAADGSKFVGNGPLAAKAPSPEDAVHDVPWLLIPQKPQTAGSSFAAFSHVQRVNTVGGVAPKDGCGATNAGAEAKVPYHATYIFYQRK
jgi:hypothetical protein